MTQGGIECWHRTMENVIKLENYYLPGQAERAIAEFVDCHNNRRYHESLNNVTPADVYFGRHREVMTIRGRIKQRTMETRRRENRVAQAA